MKKRMLAMLLALCMILPLGAIALADGDELEEPEGLPDGMWDKMTDEQRAKYEEYLEFKEAKDGQSGESAAAETAEVNEYGLTDAATQALASRIRAHLREDYLNVYGVAAADFSWSEVPADVWNAVGTVPAMAYSAGQSLTSAPEQLGMTLEDESLNALAGAVAAALREWAAEEGDDSFKALWGSLSDGRTFAQFVTEYAAFRPAKTAEDAVTEQDLQELLTCIGQAVQDEYLTPGGIDPASFAWPSAPEAWEYFHALLQRLYMQVGMGAEMSLEGLVPASPDKQIMDAAFQGLTNWLGEFEDYPAEYLDKLSISIEEDGFIPANVTFG